MDSMGNLLVAFGSMALHESAKDKTCKKCKYFADKQLGIMLTFSCRPNTSECDKCKNHNKFKKKK